MKTSTNTYNSYQASRSLLALLHLGLGIVLLIGGVTKLYSLVIVALGFLFIVKDRNEHNQAMYWAAYMIGGEVLFRMSGGMIFHELPKYSVLSFLFIGLLIEKQSHPLPVSYFVYLLLLSIGIVFVELPYGESLRKAIAFNLSGPVTLGVAALYFYKRPIQIQELLDVLFVMLLPILSMVVYIFFRAPSISDIAFGGQANFAASGGYGPNQVATILGLGIVLYSILLYARYRIFSLPIDLFLLVYLIYRGLVTFSRGGMLTAGIVLAVFFFFAWLGSQQKIKNALKIIGLVGMLGMGLFLYVSNITGGMLLNRYTNKNTRGIEKKDITTGRATLFSTEVEAFLEHPFTGIGVGGSKYYRLDKLENLAASHNELSRLLSEHGMIGIIIILLLLWVPLQHIRYQPLLARGLLLTFLGLWFLTINHSAMRIAMPAFVYGLSVMQLHFTNAFDLSENSKD